MSNAVHTGATHPPGDLRSALAEVRGKWGWFVGLGILMLVLGIFAFANVFIATLATVIYIGVLMMIAAVAQIVHAFQVRRWGAFLLWLLAGLLYGAAGFIVFYNPVVAIRTLTLAVGIALLFVGALRIGAGIRTRPGIAWGWLVAAGVASALLGVLIILGWPQNTPWLLGMFLAIDLTFQGVATIAFGAALKPARSNPRP